MHCSFVVSIARRLLDPLAELVKIDPKHIGVGQYQVNYYKFFENQEIMHVFRVRLTDRGMIIVFNACSMTYQRVS